VNRRDLYVVVVEELLKGILTSDGIRRWWNTEIDGLAGDTPSQALDAGRYEELLALVQGYRDTSFS
jgi:hypothetical protein